MLPLIGRYEFAITHYGGLQKKNLFNVTLYNNLKVKFIKMLFTVVILLYSFNKCITVLSIYVTVMMQAHKVQTTKPVAKNRVCLCKLACNIFKLLVYYLFIFL